MRLGMRSYTLGAACWQGDCGPYWGHNAILRLAPFIEHCHLPVLPGTPPLGGHVLSHDQLEAVLMRRAGYEVRVLPDEDGSWEENPPSLPEFIRRDLRWCQGNMQYFHFLAPARAAAGQPLPARCLPSPCTSSSPAWLAFMLLGLIRPLPFRDGSGHHPLHRDAGHGACAEARHPGRRAGTRAELRRAYGGAARIVHRRRARILF